MLLLLLLAVSFFSCEDEEEYPFTQSPYIELESLAYKEDTLSYTADALVISLIVWDEDGDLGVDNFEVSYPYHEYDIIFDSNDLPVELDNEVEPPFYSVPSNISFDNSLNEYVLFPEFDNKTFSSDVLMRHGEVSCDINIVLYREFDEPLILYGSRNKYHRNLFINFYDDNGSEVVWEDLFGNASGDRTCQFVSWDLKYPVITNVRQLVPLKDIFFTVERRSKYSWELSFELKSFVFRLLLNQIDAEARIQLSDRALNESNIITTGFIDLDEIRID